MSFLISDDEYEKLEQASIEAGARTISEYARLLTCGPDRETDPLLAAEVNRLQGRIDSIEERLHQLALFVEKP